MEHKDHHIWCNYFGLRPIEDCKQCSRLWENYPYDEDNLQPMDLLTKYFPDVTVR